MDQIKKIAGLGQAGGGGINDWTKMVKSSSGQELPEWLQMKMDAIDSQYGGGGSSGGGGFYSVPSIQPQMDYLKNFQNTGNQNIQGAYANLNDLYNKSTAATEATGANTTAALQKNFADAKGVQDTLAQQMQAANGQQAAIGGDAGKWAGAGVKDILAAQVAANQSNLENSRASTMASQQQYAQGMADASRQAHTVSGVDQANVTSGFNNNITNQLTQLQNQYQSELSKANAANAQAAASSSSNAGKAQADKLKALSDYLKGKDSDAKKAADKLAAQKDPKKGLQAVITAAKKAGHPELADEFNKLLGGAQSKSALGVDITDKDGNVTGNKSISLNNALKQIIDSYAGNAPGKPSMTKKVTIPAGKSWLEQFPNGSGMRSGIGFAKGQPTYKNMLDLGAPLKFLQDQAAYTAKQKKQAQLEELYNYYTGQYGG
jgi:hypothetical protein